MQMTLSTFDESIAIAPTQLPREAEFIMSALELAGHTLERRNHLRQRYRVAASLSLYSEMEDGGEPIVLYTRDLSATSLGFITRRRLPLGYGGLLTLPNPDGTPHRIDCTLLRCREVTRGWYEGALYFNRPQNFPDWES